VHIMLQQFCPTITLTTCVITVKWIELNTASATGHLVTLNILAAQLLLQVNVSDATTVTSPPVW